MKRLTALTVALLIGVTMFAQQALWGTAPVVSPEIHDNNTVTFRFKAPKAVRVQLTGDFLPVQKNAKYIGSHQHRNSLSVQSVQHVISGLLAVQGHPPACVF